MIRLTVSVPFELDDNRVLSFRARDDGRYDVRYIDALGAHAFGIAEKHEIDDYLERRIEADAKMAAEGADG